jgi:hypothetical protein
MHIPSISIFVAGLFVPKQLRWGNSVGATPLWPLQLPGTPTRKTLVGAAGDRLSLAANCGDEFALVVKSTFVVDLFVPKPSRLPGTPTRKALVGVCSPTELP